jgi:hypothetical protein
MNPENNMMENSKWMMSLSRPEHNGDWVNMIAEVIKSHKPGSHQMPLLALSNTTSAEEASLNNEYYVSIKPELLDFRGGVRVHDTLNQVFISLEKHGCLVVQVVLITADSVEGREAIHRQYFVLRRVAEVGLAALPDDVCASVVETCAKHYAQARIVGAMEGLRTLGMTDPIQLQDEWDRQGGFKIGPGIYGCRLGSATQPLIVLNGFYPAQFNNLTRKGGYLLLLKVKGDLQLSRFRTEVIGGVNPLAAKLGSIRRELHRQQQALSIAEVSIAHNAIHVSPNSFDTMAGIGFMSRLSGEALGIETSRFWSLAATFDPMLLRELRAYAKFNAKVTEQQFQLHVNTEDLEPHECLEVLQKLLSSNKGRHLTLMG